MTSPRRRVQVANPTDGGFFYWVAKLYLFSFAVILVLLFAGLVGAYGYFARTSPPLPDLSRYHDISPGVTRIFAGDGSLLGEFAEERREFVPYERIPPKLAQAFLAAEDHSFFTHGGLYPKGIARAAWRNLTAGEFSQGGSTITQQVAKQFLGREKTLLRKAREAIVARRLEALYTKEEILSVYLNQIFLGGGAYGVKAAAHRYFGKELDELDLGEMATIAGLAQAPSRDSPLGNLENARRRRDVVLDKMARHGFVNGAEAAHWKEAPLVVHPPSEIFLSTEPYFAAYVRGDLNARLGPEAVLRRGLVVETSVVPWVDAVAAENVDFAARKQDKRQGWRGPEARLEGETRDTFVARQRRRYGDAPLVPGRRYLALVESVEDGERGEDVDDKKKGEVLARVGDRHLRIPYARLKWAAPWSRSDAENDRRIDLPSEALRAGDVVWVSPPLRRIRRFSDWTFDERLNPHWVHASDVAVPDDVVDLEQTPHPQAAIYTIDHQTGYVLAMAGGQDFSRSEYNRATQACRQPGSTYKPIYYSLALEQGFGFETLLNDVPHAEVDPITGEVWVPVNLHGTMDFEVTLEYALVYSKNVPSVDLFTKVGAAETERWARRLGFTSPIIADKALALGASCTYMDELTRAFAIFARNGRWLDIVGVRRILDRNGRVLEDHTVPYDPMLPPAARLDRLAALAAAPVKQAIPARVAFLTTTLLEEVVSDGYSGPIRSTDVPAAGKTGTSSDTMDLWFSAFTTRWATTAWLGDDLRERPLGKDDAAYMSAVPMWARYMAEASADLELGKKIPWEVPHGVNADDRGGDKGKQAEAPMALDPPKKQKTDAVPDGVSAEKKRHSVEKEKKPRKPRKP